MAEQRLRSSSKKVHKMTKEGLVEKNLTEQTVKRVSKRLVQAEFKNKPKEEKADAHNKKKDKIKKRQHLRKRLPFERKDRLKFTSEEYIPEESKVKKRLLKKNQTADKQKELQNTVGNKKNQYKEKVKNRAAYGEVHQNKKVKVQFKGEYEVKKEKVKYTPPGKFTAVPFRKAVVISQNEAETDDNAAMDGVKAGEQLTISAYRFTSRKKDNRKKRKYERAHKLEQHSMRSKIESHYQERLRGDEKLPATSNLKRFIQKQQIKRRYAKAYRAEKAGGTAAKGGAVFMKTASRKVLTFFAEHKGIALSLAAFILLLVVLMSSVTSCSMGALQILANTMAASYLSEPEEIEKAELYYTELEASFQKKINEMEEIHPGLDEYRYNVGEIGHDPHVLISYLSAKFEVFEFEQVKAEIEMLFEIQYGISVEQVQETKTETKTIQVGESLGNVKTSGYCSCVICCGIWSGGPTASGVMPKGNHTIAVDATNPIVPMGTKIVMNGVEFTVEDTGNFADFGVAFDIYYDNHADASVHGHREWEAFLAEGNENTVEVTKTETVEVLNVTVTAKTLRGVIMQRMNEEEKELYELIYSTKGNLQIYASPIELNWYVYTKSYYGYRINSATGNRELHRGIEISVTGGTEVKSGQNGSVNSTGYDDYYGYYVVTQDENGYQLKYGHLQNIQVTKGQKILVGDVIGKTGSTGSVIGSQLYLELVKDGICFNPIFYVDTGTGGIGGSGSGYDDEAVPRLFEEAEKYLGMPYVWGGSSPATSFDCSGFICYVFTNSGVYNMERTTAQGIYDMCTPIDPADAQPGDIIFFTGTYNAGVPVSHVGIYAGDGMMIHCGNPIQYASIHSSYWQQHFYGFGRPSY